MNIKEVGRPNSQYIPTSEIPMAAPKIFIYVFLVLFAVATGFLAWQAGFFSVDPEIIPPNADSLFIMGADHSLSKQIRDKLELTGFIARDTRYVAIVNSQVVENNGLISLNIGSQTVVLQVKSISSDKIIVGVHDP